MPKPPSRKSPPIRQVLEIMAALRAPDGCPWDREQDHQSLRWHAVEEVYELLDAIESKDDVELSEELGDVLLQVVFHAQLGKERGAFDFETICQQLADKLVRRHPHVFGDIQVNDVDQVWANWEKIKKSEKQGTRHERPSALDGIPRQLPALMKAQKLWKKAVKAGLTEPIPKPSSQSKKKLAQALWEITQTCQQLGWSAEELLAGEIKKMEAGWRNAEQRLPSQIQRKTAKRRQSGS